MPAPPPEKASRIAEPLDPIEVCTVSTPSMPVSTASTFCAAASSASSEAAGASSCVTVNVFWPLSPRKFVFMSGARATVPPSTTTAISRVTHEWFSVQLSTGR